MKIKIKDTGKDTDIASEKPGEWYRIGECHTTGSPAKCHATRSPAKDTGIVPEKRKDSCKGSCKTSNKNSCNEDKEVRCKQCRRKVFVDDVRCWWCKTSFPGKSAENM